MNHLCPVCKNSDQSIIYQCTEFVLLECSQCKLVMKSYGEELRREDVQYLQDSVYADLRRTDISKVIKAMAFDRLKLLKSFQSKGYLLEIGCATGEFLEVARENGFQVLGVEASERYASYASHKGLDVRRGRLEDVAPKEYSFNVVAMFHLFEHIETPNEFLQIVKKTMVDEGLLMILVPNLESVTNRIFGFQHPGFHQNDHLFFYNKSTLSKILTNNGFEILSITSKEYPHHPFTSFQGYLMQSLKRKMKQKQSISTKQVGGSPRSIEQSNDNRAKEILNKLFRNTPYFLGTLFYPLLRVYGIIVEHYIKGHDLIVFARK
jgi:2-polyprenyl-3-methyl-5-hydroxy-6-metoxy-1,4-benzoquinol methylase